MQDKLDPGKGNRTFKSRLEFIAEIFSHPHTKTEILTSCIQFKLNKTYEQYVEDLNKSLDCLAQANPEKVIKKINKGE